MCVSVCGVCILRAGTGWKEELSAMFPVCVSPGLSDDVVWLELSSSGSEFVRRSPWS